MKTAYETDEIRYYRSDNGGFADESEKRIAIPEGRTVSDEDVVVEVLRDLGWRRDEVDVSCWGAYSMDGIEIDRKDTGERISAFVTSEYDIVRESGGEAIRALNADDAMVHCFREFEDDEIDPNTGDYPPYDGPAYVEPEWSIQLWWSDDVAEPGKRVTDDHYWADDKPFIPLGGAKVFATRDEALAECERLNRDRVFPDRTAYPKPRFDWLMK
jgi:hypothetical protein